MTILNRKRCKAVIGLISTAAIGGALGGISPWPPIAWQFWAITCPLALFVGLIGGHLSWEWSHK